MSQFTSQPTALVTGASSGIGLEIARRLAGRGVRLALVARRADRLAELADALRRDGVTVEAIRADIADPVERAAALAACRHRFGPIDLLINNAGRGDYGPLADADPGVLVNLLRLNIEALVELTRAVLPEMVKRRSGRILHVASMAGFCPLPYMSAYAASKAFVISFSLGVRAEAAPAGVTVSCLCPGTTRTEFFDHGGLPSRRGEFLTMAREPASVAAAGVEGMLRGRAIIVPGWLNRLSVFGQRHLPPAWLAGRIAGFMRPRENQPG